VLDDATQMCRFTLSALVKEISDNMVADVVPLAKRRERAGNATYP
jgi:hypothetical protein